MDTYQGLPYTRFHRTVVAHGKSFTFDSMGWPTWQTDEPCASPQVTVRYVLGAWCPLCGFPPDCHDY